MSGAPPLEVWFEFASTYSYLAVARVEDEARAAGVEVAWRPFLLGPLFRRQGWSDSPFNLYPAKGRYMWRDLERLCADYGLPFARPSAFPRNGLLAARVALAFEGEPWCPDFARRAFEWNFARDRDIGSESVVRDLLTSLGQPASDVLEAAHAEDNKRRLRERTEEAARRGIFGAPSFFARGELYWGHDRLPQALRACRSA